MRWLQQFVEREWPLLLPVALAFFGLPKLVVTLVMAQRITVVPQTVDDMRTLMASLPGWWTGMVTALLIVMLIAAVVGAMTLIGLATRSRSSVGEAILESLKRAPVAVAMIVLVGLLLFVLLIVAMTVAALAGGGQTSAVVLSFFGIIATVLIVPLLLPIVLRERLGLIGTLREGRHLYSGSVTRISGGLILFALGTWVVLVAVKVSAGSLILLAGRSLGQPELGDALEAVLESVTASIGWGGFYLLVASFYRQRAGLE